MKPQINAGRCAGIALTAVLPGSLLVPAALAPGAASASDKDSIVPATFAAPRIEYRPGVRWWWPGNAASTEDLLAQLDYLHDNGFGAVEIVAFNKEFYPNGVSGNIYDAASRGYDTAAVLGSE